MKALGVLGTASGVGKSWLATALCAWLRGQGVRVAPFKAQNMSNNAFATMDGGEMARAQAVQAEACGLRPVVEMNPILLKPSGEREAQLVLKGQALAHQSAQRYFAEKEKLWAVVRETLQGWREKCDVLVMEGAGSPVELNLMAGDLANLRPLREVDARWLLVGDVDRGGIFAQLAGTWALLPEADRARCLGAVVNRFRGDLSLFRDAGDWLAPHAAGLGVLGTVPWRGDLQPEEEDGLAEGNADRGAGERVAWVRYPQVANVSDAQPWWDDAGVRTQWVTRPEEVAEAKVIVLPGSKNTIGDLRWLRETGLAAAVLAAAQRGALVIGICGGYQMLGRRLLDRDGVAGDAGDVAGLGLLPVTTEFSVRKVVRAVTAICEGREWQAYEIHAGWTGVAAGATGWASLQQILPREEAEWRAEGVRAGRVWGTYLHGWFEAPEVRRWVAREAGLVSHRASDALWAEKRQRVYAAMAEHFAAHVEMEPLRRAAGI